MYVLGMIVLAGCLGQTAAMAALVPTPEIDGGTLSTGLAALTAAVLIVRSRRRSK